MLKARNQFRSKYYLYLIIFLGFLSAFGPFITDMYLPTLPSMAEVFKTVPSKVQLGLTTSLLGLAIGQIFFGPLSDKYGRKVLLWISLILFAFSTLGCIFSVSIDVFNSWRFVQGLGGAGGIVLSRSIATDCFSGKELAKSLAIIGAINGTMPVIAPVAGGMVAETVGWQGIFFALFCVGVGLMVFTIPFEESLGIELRFKGKLSSIFSSYVELFKNKRFLFCVLICAFSYGVLFAYISSSAFIVQDHYGFSEFYFSLTFGINAIAMAAGSACVAKINNLSFYTLLANIAVAVLSILQLLFFILYDNFYSYESLTFLLAFLLGFIFTSSSALAMEAGRSKSGTASAILGASGFLIGGLTSPLVGLGNIMFSSILIIFICASMASLFSLFMNRTSLKNHN